jgi:hypothetical protein
MNPVFLAVIAAVVTVVPGYFIGKAVKNRPLIYNAIFFGTLAVMVAVVAWALVAGRIEIVGLALGTGFGLVNGVRHGFKPVFSPVIKAGRQDSEDT